MMDVEKPNAEETIPCEVCLKEIPISEAKSEEANDYARYFYGLDCYTKWRLQDTMDENN